MERALSVILLAVSMCISAVIVTAGIRVSRFGDQNIKSAMMQVQEAVSVEDADIARLEKGAITGMEAVALLQKFDSSGYGHLVVTSGKKEGSYSADGINDIHSDNYINPSTLFNGMSVKDENGVVFAVVFTQQGEERVPFNAEEAKKVGKSVDGQVQDSQYRLFKKALLNRAKCNEYLRLCSSWAGAIKDLDDAQMRSVYTKYSDDVENQEEYLSSQIVTYDAQSQFCMAVAGAVKEWTDGKWFEAILTTGSESSEDLDEYGPDDVPDNPWYDIPDVPEPDDPGKIDDSNLNIDSDTNDSVNDGNDTVIPDSPAPSAGPSPDVSPQASGSPVLTESPEVSVGPSGVPEPSEEPTAVPTTEPEPSEEPEPSGMPEPSEGPGVIPIPEASPTAEPEGTTVPILGPDDVS